ncbi:hypothetical protein CRP01_05300 [Flavilitoribacter nigricans DSM 23189 = NBRC 102662]|uniref:Uncharacterized protein n=1 Tax=Flavilitoribacter nigricans (strain ATCC 23147 / DSM 23189 / NBRC 102662 / NCIMB 1420 / SS-2) TaxID=1122177 RepID=A0A2D0NGH6_FLAN2|nr:hypothetical protein CRP01_05300 [Flavilitoribacter nigricans DSM 23189 = NBRC 102662]
MIDHQGFNPGFSSVCRYVHRFGAEGAMTVRKVENLPQKESRTLEISKDSITFTGPKWNLWSEVRLDRPGEYY